MSLPQTTPLLLPSQYNASVVTAAFPSGNTAQLLRAIVRASEFLQRVTERRYDERIETRRYNNFLERDGGDLLDAFTLLLDDDLKSVIQFAQRVPIGSDKTIDDGAQIDVNQCRLLYDSEQQGTGITVFSKIHVNRYSGAFFYTGGVDPYENIWLEGVWGYGGQWIVSGTTLSAALNTSATSMTVSDGTVLEVGMMLQIDTEYVYCDAISSNTITIVRGCNGSTAAAHNSAAGVNYWQPLSTVSDLVARLVQWRIEQIKTPLAGTATVGDFSFPVDVGGLPKDLYLIIRDAHLGRRTQAYGV